jgi:hypothetical protein
MGTELGQLEIRDTSDTVTRITLNGDTAGISAGGKNRDGELLLKDSNDNVRVQIGTIAPFHPALPWDWAVTIKAADGTNIARLGQSADLTLGGAGHDGDLLLKDKAGKFRIRVGADEPILVALQ